MTRKMAFKYSDYFLDHFM